MEEQQKQSIPSLEDCLKLLKGERDEQRLAGLLLVTKLCNKDDYPSICSVYDAIGVQFLDRLLRTGMGKGGVSGSGSENREAYLQLLVTVLAAFCRVPEIASSEDMVSKIPLILEAMSKELGTSVLEECYEFLFLVSNAHKDGVSRLYDYGGMSVLASQMSTLPDGCYSIEFSMRLVQLVISTMYLDTITSEYSSELAMMVAAISKQFAVLHNALKFEALHLLSAILSKYSAPLHEALLSMNNDVWSTFIRVGVVAILQNRVAPAEKFQALILVESTISVVGEGWLIGQMNLSNTEDPVPADRCMLLVLESSRVEVAVLLNELAYLKYEASKNSSSNSEPILLKQRNLAVVFSLVERIIKLISNIGGDEGSVISEGTLMKVISGLNETIGVVLEYLQDAKDHGQTKGDDLLASVRVVGSYLAETPHACKETVRDLLGYMLSIEGGDEPSPFYSVCFLLPMLCQATLEDYGCKVLVSSGAYKAVVECLIKLVGPDGSVADDNVSVYLACDTVVNLLLKRDRIQVPIDDTCFIRLLGSLAYWTGDTVDLSVLMMASTICSLIFDSMSEETLLQHPSFDHRNLLSLSHLIARSLAINGQAMTHFVGLEERISRCLRSYSLCKETKTEALTKLASAHEHIGQLEGRLTEAGTVLNEKVEEVAALKAECAKMLGDNGRLQADNARLVAEHAAELQALKDAHATQLSDLERANYDLGFDEAGRMYSVQVEAIRERAFKKGWLIALRAVGNKDDLAVMKDIPESSSVLSPSCLPTEDLEAEEAAEDAPAAEV